MSLLGPDDPPPFQVAREDGASPWFLIADHAGRAIPKAVGQLGLEQTDLDRHIAWDIGIAGVAAALSAALGATLVTQPYSRLVIDCNRPPGVASSIPSVSEATAIPGNRALSTAAAVERRRAIFDPYHDRIAALLDAREAAGRTTVLLSLHSFTPVYLGQTRRVEVGTLYGEDGRLAHALYSALRAEGDLIVGDNEPYAVSAETDYAVPVHGVRRGLLHTAIEIRQDLIVTQPSQQAWAARLARLLPGVLAGT